MVRRGGGGGERERRGGGVIPEDRLVIPLWVLTPKIDNATCLIPQGNMSLGDMQH